MVGLVNGDLHALKKANWFSRFFKAAHSDANENGCSCRAHWTSSSKDLSTDVCWASVCLGPLDPWPATRSEGFLCLATNGSPLLSEMSKGFGHSVTHPPRSPHCPLCSSQCTYSGFSKNSNKRKAKEDVLSWVLLGPQWGFEWQNKGDARLLSWEYGYSGH